MVCCRSIYFLYRELLRSKYGNTNYVIHLCFNCMSVLVFISIGRMKPLKSICYLLVIFYTSLNEPLVDGTAALREDETGQLEKYDELKFNEGNFDDNSYRVYNFTHSADLFDSHIRVRRVGVGSTQYLCVMTWNIKDFSNLTNNRARDFPIVNVRAV